MILSYRKKGLCDRGDRVWKMVSADGYGRDAVLILCTALNAEEYGMKKTIIVMPVANEESTMGNILEKMNLTDNLHPIMGILVLFLPMLAAISLPSGLWCLLRYNKDRVAAIKHHYRQSIWKDAIPMWLLWIIPLLFDILLLVIYLTMIK